MKPKQDNRSEKGRLERISGWGRYPWIMAEIRRVRNEQSARWAVNSESPLISRGMGRSYGDSSLCQRICLMDPMSCFLDFDEEKGVLTCQAGASLAEIMDVFLPRGWFPSVVPGTKYITVGGAIASDVHGKNHHLAGCFSNYVPCFDLMLADGGVKSCSADENADLFHATAGGMGLTGVILRAKVRLKRVPSAMIHQQTFKAPSLHHVFELFEQNSHAPYSVAWIDCLATGKHLGRSLLMIGDHARQGRLTYYQKKKRTVWFDFPSFALNPFTVRLFNTLYYHRIRGMVQDVFVDVDTFFHPLDAISGWNRIYGKSGFTQYQFVLPKEAGLAGLGQIMERIARARLGSFLAVLKLFGPGNENWLSFPMEGYTLALDMKIQPGLFALLDELDRIVLDHGGRLYLAKDARMSREMFDGGYAQAQRFRDLRRTLGLADKFLSLQSRRLEV